jgi:hypothetical protein
MSIEKDLDGLGRAHRRFAAATAEELEGKIVQHVAKLEKERGELHDLLLRVWNRWDAEDTGSAPVLAFDIAQALGDDASAVDIAYRYGSRIVSALPEYKIKIAEATGKN